MTGDRKTETVSLVTGFPVLRSTILELGLEISRFDQFRDNLIVVPGEEDEGHG